MSTTEQIKLLQGELADTKLAAARMANALVDINNDVGYMDEVADAVGAVELDIEAYRL